MLKFEQDQTVISPTPHDEMKKWAKIVEDFGVLINPLINSLGWLEHELMQFVIANIAMYSQEVDIIICFAGGGINVKEKQREMTRGGDQMIASNVVT